MKLTIVIPALNEEEAIASIIERCLAARELITDQSPASTVEIVVVSDGSTDRTAEIAARYDSVRLIVFHKNRGYGAAIKEGFETSTGDLVGFLDADGTCDPAFFATLCTAIVEQNADVALGSRMGPQSRMPRLRRLGNRIYAVLLSALTNRVVTDTASGMRVIRREALAKLYPLPDGLHFTPAMSARALVDDELKLVESPMAYEERVGESKLSVARDGLRFLGTIFHMTLMWSPARLFAGSSALLALIVVLLAMHPIETWLRRGSLQEDTIYRLLFCSLVGTIAASLLSAGVICDHLHRMLRGTEATTQSFVSCILDKVYSYRGVGVTIALTTPLMAWLVGRGIWTRLADGYVDIHWSRVVLAGLIAFGAVQMLITTLVANQLRFHTARQAGAEPTRLAERSAPDFTTSTADHAARRSADWTPTQPA